MEPPFPGFFSGHKGGWDWFAPPLLHASFGGLGNMDEAANNKRRSDSNIKDGT